MLGQLAGGAADRRSGVHEVPGQATSDVSRGKAYVDLELEREKAEPGSWRCSQGGKTPYARGKGFTEGFHQQENDSPQITQNGYSTIFPNSQKYTRDSLLESPFYNQGIG